MRAARAQPNGATSFLQVRKFHQHKPAEVHAHFIKCLKSQSLLKRHHAGKAKQLI